MGCWSLRGDFDISWKTHLSKIRSREEGQNDAKLNWNQARSLHFADDGLLFWCWWHLRNCCLWVLCILSSLLLLFDTGLLLLGAGGLTLNRWDENGGRWSGVMTFHCTAERRAGIIWICWCFVTFGYVTMGHMLKRKDTEHKWKRGYSEERMGIHAAISCF